MTWRQWFANPYRAMATVLVFIIAAPVLIPMIATLLTAAIGAWAGPLLFAGIIILAFRKMTRL